MSELGAFLGRLLAHLEQAHIPYMLVGSFASTLHGVPRASQDVDVVIDADAESLERLLLDLPDTQYYVSREAAEDALRRRSQFNVIDLATGWKADLIICKERPFSRTELDRRLRISALGLDLFVATAEDTLLSKLEWAGKAQSERQLSDAQGILEVGGDNVDNAYIERWVDALGVKSLWEQVKSRAGKSSVG